MENAKYGSAIFSVLILLIMIMINYTWGNFLMSFAVGTSGEAGIILQLMITIVMLFYTFIVPILIYQGMITNILNIFLGLAGLLIGIPIIVFAINILGLLISTFAFTGDVLVVTTFLNVILIAIFGFVVPLIIALQEETVMPLVGESE